MAASTGNTAPPVLALHGFAGTPDDVQLLTRAASSMGSSISAPYLPGHDTSYRDLAGKRWEDWSAAARRHLLEFDASRKVIVAGLSLGALLALYLARTESRRVAGVVLMGTPLRLRRPSPAGVLALVHWLRLPDFSVPKSGPNIMDPRARAEYTGYSVQPMRAAAEVWRAGLAESRRLREVRCPALILHGAHDRVSPLSNTRRLCNGLGSESRRCVVLDDSAHIVTRDHNQGIVEAEFAAFVKCIGKLP